MIEDTKKNGVSLTPLDITESLGYTTYRRESRKPWSKEEDDQLRKVIHSFLLTTGSFPQGVASIATLEDSANVTAMIDWESIATEFTDRKGKDCRKRWSNSLDPNLKKGRWTEEEDQQLVESYKQHGPSWQKVSMEIPGRTDDQCAKRYIEVLDPNTKGRLRPWAVEEDLSLITKVKAYGTKWRMISGEMKCRPSLTCRNRWRKIITDVMRGKADPKIAAAVDDYKQGSETVEELREKVNAMKAERKKQRSVEDVSAPVSEEDDAVKVKAEGETKSPVRPNHAQNQENPQQRLADSIEASVFSNKHAKPKVHHQQMDWKYTLKDTSGLSIANGGIATSELVKELIAQARKYNLKIAIHQHIHNHYAPVGQNSAKSPAMGSSSNYSGEMEADLFGGRDGLFYNFDSSPSMYNITQHTQSATPQPIDQIGPNRYSHFNYLPAQSQPRLGSSDSTKATDLNKLLNPVPVHGNTGKKRRRKEFMKPTGLKNEEDEDMDFWETLRSLSHVVGQQSTQNTPSASGVHTPIQQDLSNEPLDRDSLQVDSIANDNIRREQVASEEFQSHAATQSVQAPAAGAGHSAEDQFYALEDQEDIYYNRNHEFAFLQFNPS